MLKSHFRRFLSFFCCICFMANFFTGLSDNIAKAANETCTLTIEGYEGITDSRYQYKSNGNPSGSLSVTYKVAENAESVVCVPDQSTGKISNIPVGAQVVFTLECENGFTPYLAVNQELQELTPENETTFSSTVKATSTEMSAIAAFVNLAEETENVKINLMYLSNGQVQSGTYNEEFKATWGTIEYSTDGGSTYKELGDGVNANSEGTYVFDSNINSVIVKISWTNNIMASIDGAYIDNGIETTIQKGTHIIAFEEGFYTVAWVYSGAGVSEDMLLKNGKVSIEPGDGIEGQATEMGGGYKVEPGTTVTIHCVPDYGYQFTKSEIDGVEFTPTDEQSTYTFVMPEKHIYLSNIFTENPDTVNLETNSIIEGRLSNVDKAINSGNAEVNIKDAVMTDDLKSKVTQETSQNGFSPISYLDIEFINFITKGNTGERWENSINQLENPVKLTLKLSDNLRGANEYKIMKIHNGETTMIDATYDSSEGTISFDYDEYSQYAILAPSTSGISVTEALKTGDKTKQVIVCSAIMAASAAAFVYVCTLKKKKSKM